MWEHLAAAAPQEILSDVEDVRDAWIAQEEAAQNGDWRAAIVGATLNANSIARVDAFTVEACGVKPVTSTDELGGKFIHEDIPILMEGVWTDRDGYEFGAHVHDAFAVTATVLTEKYKPREAGVEIVYKGMESGATLVTNTADRIVPVPEKMYVFPVWRRDSGLCELVDNPLGTFAIGKDEEYCTTPLWNLSGLNAPGIRNTDFFDLKVGGGTRFARPIDEDMARKFAPALEKPAGWVMAVSGLSDSSAKCSIEGARVVMESAPLGCLP